MEFINKYLSGAIVPAALAFFALFFLVKLKGLPLSNPMSIIKGIFKKNSATGVTPIKAVIFALAGTLGVGNIVGVASAIALGGAGSVFWMWISALLAMILKYSEVVLAVLHRRVRGAENYGGAMYYMKDFFYRKGKRLLGCAFTMVFVVFCLVNGFTMGCIIQTNAISSSVSAVVNASPLAVGAALAMLAAVVFLFNGKKIFSICEKLVPLVSIVYVIMSCAVIILCRDRMLDVICEILTDAFSFRSAGAGLLGFFTSKALRYGTIRGLFSNEAGCGTAPIAHATANTSSACEQGFFGILEVFIDTILVCSMTAFVILLNKEAAFQYSAEPILMAFASFEAALGSFSNVVLCISVFLFAFATVICWGYYGKECIYYINKSKAAERAYYLIYIFFIFLGSFISLDFVWELADLAVGVMTLMNLFILANMSDEIKKETAKYYRKRASRGKL